MHLCILCFLQECQPFFNNQNKTTKDSTVSANGIIKGRNYEGDLYFVEDIIEKPKIEEAPSNLGTVGRYVFTPEIFDCIKKTSPGVGNEI